MIDQAPTVDHGYDQAIVFLLHSALLLCSRKSPDSRTVHASPQITAAPSVLFALSQEGPQIGVQRLPVKILVYCTEYPRASMQAENARLKLSSDA